MLMDADIAAQAAQPDRDFDGLKGDVVFCAWTGTNAFSPQRADALLSIYREACCPVLLVTPMNLAQWTLPEAPFHPAFEHLSQTHKADYIRCYLMHHFGGGYTDIKKTSVSWRPFFAAMRETPAALGLGYTEIGPQGVPPMPDPIGTALKVHYAKLIGNCAYIFRRRSDFTTAWYTTLHRILDEKLPLLRVHPAQHPQDQAGVLLPNGEPSPYPLRWAEILAEIFHPLVLRHHDRFLHANIAPQFYAYR